MGLDITLAVVFVGVLIFASYLFAEFFRVKAFPDVLLLMLIGLIIGPFAGIINQSMFGHIGNVFAHITLVVILFEGGTQLRANILKQALKGTASITLVNFLVSTIVTGLLTLFIFDYDVIPSFMLGALLGGTASAIVIPMVSQMRMHDRSKAILILESAVSDVLCVVVGLAFFEAYKLGELKIGMMFGNIITSFSFSLLTGLIGGLAWSFLLNKARTIQNSIFTTPAFVFIIFGISELMGFSGAISALMFGITIANIDVLPLPALGKLTKYIPHTLNETEKMFFSEVVFLLKTFFFVYIGISIVLTDYFSIGVGLLLSLTYFFLRVFIVKISVRSKLPLEDRIIMSMMVPKGLAAAVLASLPSQAGMPGGELIQNITYSAIFISIVINSILIFINSKSSFAGKFYGFFLKP